MRPGVLDGLRGVGSVCVGTDPGRSPDIVSWEWVLGGGGGKSLLWQSMAGRVRSYIDLIHIDGAWGEAA